MRGTREWWSCCLRRMASTSIRGIYGRTPQFEAGPGGARGGGRATAGQGQNAGLVGGRNGCGGAVAVAPKA